MYTYVAGVEQALERVLVPERRGLGVAQQQLVRVQPGAQLLRGFAQLRQQGAAWNTITR